ncbi:hypothetical protein BGZ57DRAFT_304214 [Hyaloscypha finlandica]|nr:hypothetical protein BGZ57DRAFT_304214 [Hyaloscypha finlandica]
MVIHAKALKGCRCPGDTHRRFKSGFRRGSGEAGDQGRARTGRAALNRSHQLDDLIARLIQRLHNSSFNTPYCRGWKRAAVARGSLRGQEQAFGPGERSSHLSFLRICLTSPTDVAFVQRIVRVAAGLQAFPGVFGALSLACSPQISCQQFQIPGRTSAGISQDHQGLHCREDLSVAIIWAKLDRLVLTPPDKEDAENRHADRGAAARAKVNLFREGEIPDVCLSEYVLIGKSNDRPVRHGSLKISFGAKFGVVRLRKETIPLDPREPLQILWPKFPNLRW